MKLFIIVLAVVFAVMSSSGDKSPTAEHRGYSYPDELLSESENNVDLTIFRCSDNYICCTEGGGWISTYIGKPDGIDIPDGGFMSVNADITRYYGGVTGFRGNPNINRIHKSSPLSFDEAVGKGIVGDYVPGSEIIYNRPLKYSSGSKEYLLINLRGVYFIYLEGQAVGTYKTTFEAEAAMGLYSSKDPTAEFEQRNNENIYVLRCGDKYLSYVHNIFFNRYWTPILNTDFENKPTGFTLQDGEVVYIKHADIVKVNGGSGGYVNAPMFTGPAEPEKIRYDWLTLSTSMPHWEEGAPVLDGEAVQYFSSSSIYIIIRLDGKYSVYRGNGDEEMFIGVYETASQVDNAIGRKGGKQ